MTPASLRCPVCRAENTERTCRRCRADLGLLWDLEARRDDLLKEARRGWERGELDAVRRAAEAAAELRAGPELERWLALTSLAAGDFGAALARWRRARTQAAGEGSA